MTTLVQLDSPDTETEEKEVEPAPPISEEMRQEIQDRVDGGCSLLNEHAPENWHRKVDLKRLVMADINWCVLGQVFAGRGNWSSGYSWARENLMDDDIKTAESLGFSANGWNWRSVMDLLQVAWHERISALQEADKEGE